MASFPSHLWMSEEQNSSKGIPTMGLPIACKPYPLQLKYQKFIDEEIGLLENAGCISKSLSLWPILGLIVPTKPDPLNP